jgi:hypothetical protein
LQNLRVAQEETHITELHLRLEPLEPLVVVMVEQE